MQKLKFSIPTPCIEDWSNMSPNETGRFCQICEKDVVDFSEMSDDEVLGYFINKKATSKLCVRMNDQQLNEGITLNTRKVYFPKFIRKMAAVTLIGISIGGMPILVNGQDVVQEIQNDTIQVDTIKGNTILKIKVPATTQSIKVQKLKKPAQTIIHKIPAEYKTITKKKLGHKGGLDPGWQEIECVLPEGEIAVEMKILQKALKEKGYFKGEINNVLTDDLKDALIQFKKDHRLLPNFELDEDTAYLLGIEWSK